MDRDNGPNKNEMNGIMDTDEKIIDQTLPWGVYIPPSSSGKTPDSDDVMYQKHDGDDDGDAAATELHHGGYVQIVDAKGKFFPCSFSRPVGVVMEKLKRRKRRLSDMSADQDVGDVNGFSATTTDGNSHDGMGENLTTISETEVEYKKRTITEERLHPEEALFLHLRGLLRIQSNNSGDTTETDPSSSIAKPKSSVQSTMSTQDLFTTILTECNVPLAAYLAYAHLRAQGYNLIRYTDTRMNLLRRLHEMKLKLSAAMDEENQNSLPDETCTGEDASKTDSTKNGDSTVSVNSSLERIKNRSLRLELSNDVAMAPSPCVVSLQVDETATCNANNHIRLAYHAYNPNSQFKRSNPGMPDFGVAVMPFHSDTDSGEPTFDTLASLVSMLW